MDITQKYNRKYFIDFLQNEFLSNDFKEEESAIPIDVSWKKFKNITELGKSDSLNLTVFEFEYDSVNDPRVTLTRDSFSVLKKYGRQNALAVFYCSNDSKWRFSFLTFSLKKNDNEKIVRDFSNPRRYSFLLGNECKRHTPETMLFAKGKVRDIADLQKRFAIESVTKEFYNRLFNWYSWACSVSKFPIGCAHNVELTATENNKNLIRFITRIIFVWFLKHTGLVPEWIFDEKQIDTVLKDFRADSTKEGNYYNGILQNLFFATLNKAITERAFTDDRDGLKNMHYGIKTLYRDRIDGSMFKKSHDEIVSMFRSVPFLNGGLFECLDSLDTDDEKGEHSVQTYIDGFSREKSRSAFIPNILFFNHEESEHQGLFGLLNTYNFTVEENTPSDVEVALDPELLGKVFENLLGTYNPETQKTARKESGSFYTPREIVNYMVDESLIAHIHSHVPGVPENDIRELFRDSSDVMPETIAKNRKEIIELLIGTKDNDNSFKKQPTRILDPACGSGAFPMGILNRMVMILNKLNDNEFKNEYQMKLYLIENCIYGVDIQPIAVQIAKLRFFISLICDQKRTDDASHNYGFEPLPNLETKFVAADTITRLPRKNEPGLFEDEKIKKTQAELLDIRHKHFSAKTSEEKKNLRKEDKKLCKTLADLLKQDQYINLEQAEKLSMWNPYNQNATSDFFDPEWMYGIKNENSGFFDIVIANPPYIQLQDNHGALADKYKNQEYECFTRTGDLYQLFYERGFNLLCNNGHLCYITSNKWMRAGYGECSRKYFFDNANPLLLIDFADQKIFDSVTVNVNIMLLEKGKNCGKTQSCTIKDDCHNYLNEYIEQNSSILTFPQNDSWILLNQIEQQIKEKIEKAGKPLKEWDISINYGIKTGCNDAFIIDKAKRDELVAKDAKSAEIIRPILRGRDIKRYHADFKDRYLLFIPWHFPLQDDASIRRASIKAEKLFMEQYPVIYNHLLQYKDRLSARNQVETGICYEWYALQRWGANYWEDFSYKKIAWGNLNLMASFTLASENMFINAPCPMIVPGDKYLLGILNSRLADFYIRSLGVTRNGGYFEYKPMFVEKLPVPQPAKKVKEQIEQLVTHLLYFQNENDDIVLNKVIYNLYNLDYTEIAYLENKYLLYKH